MRWTSSPSRPRLAVPLALVVSEATWGSLLLNGLFDTGRGPRLGIGVLTVAVPAATAVVLGATVTRPTPHSPRRRRWLRAAVLAVVVVAGTALSAGVIAELARSGSFWRVASHPWASSGHRAATVAGGSWFIAALAWGRGTWIGVAPPSFAHAARSVGAGALAFVGVFAGRADGHAIAFRSATASAGWLLFLAFPFAVAALALIRQGELQEEVAPGSRSEAGPVWLSVLAVPLLGAALVAFLVALAVGPVAPVVGRGVARAGKAIWWVVVKVAAALWHLIPRSPPHRLHGTTGQGRSPLATAPHLPAHGHPVTVPLALEVVLGIVALAVVVLVVRALRPLQRLRHRLPTPATEGETDSVFSWRHLAAQLWRAMARLLTGGRRRRAPTAPPAPLPEVAKGQLTSVRLAYRGVLATARTGGWPRAATETTNELGRRLGAGPAAAQAVALAELTELYDAVRYGERPHDDRESAVATAQADAVRHALTDSAAAIEAADP